MTLTSLPSTVPQLFFPPPLSPSPRAAVPPTLRSRPKTTPSIKWCISTRFNPARASPSSIMSHLTAKPRAAKASLMGTSSVVAGRETLRPAAKRRDVNVVWSREERAAWSASGGRFKGRETRYMIALSTRTVVLLSALNEGMRGKPYLARRSHSPLQTPSLHSRLHLFP
jgi:hypothetical protein